MLNYLFADYIKCVSCNDEIYDDMYYGLCLSCYEKLTFTSDYMSCMLCGRPILKDGHYNKCIECQKHDRSFSRGYSCLIYEGISERLIMDYKYNDKTYLYKFISHMIAKKIEDENIKFDYIAYTPIHFTRKLVRGFNQTELMANYISILKDKMVLKDLIIRRKMTRRLKKLSRSERLSQLDGAFEFNDSFDINGASILLIDDIFTTGSTLNACSDILIEQGALEVKIITFAVKCNYDYNVYK